MRTLIAEAKRRLWPTAAAPTPLVPDLDVDADFDPVFYRERYPDLGHLSEADLGQHYMRWGKLAEARSPNAAHFYAELQARLGPLPPRFDAAAYRAMHADLRANLRNEYEAAEHYLLAGRREKRDFAEFDVELYRSLHFAGTVITDYELGLHYRREGVALGLVGSWRQLLAERGGRHGGWIDALRTDEFALLNRSWCGPIASKLDAVDAMVREGIDRLAPIAFDLQFDLGYYREVHPEHQALAPAALYRRWLYDELDKGWSGSPERHVRAMGLAISDYPAGFDWRGYLAARFDGEGDRWSALDTFMYDGFAITDRTFATGEGAQSWLMALGDVMRGRDDALAIRAYEEARAIEDGYAVSHHLGDAFLRTKHWPEALARFQFAAQFPQAELWTFVNGARAAIRLGAFRAARALLEAGRPTVGGDPHFRGIVSELIEAYFHARVRRIRALYTRPDARVRADAKVTALVASVEAMWTALDPMGAPIPASPEARVVMLANFDIRVCTHYRIEQKRELFERLDRPFEVYGLHEVDAFLAALPGAAAAFFFRLPAWPTVIRAIAAATAMTIPTYYEIDDLIFDAEHYPDTLESYGGLLSAAAYEGLLFGVPLFRAAIARCDYAIVSTSPLARAVEPIVKTGRAFWLPNGLDRRNDRYLDDPPKRLRRDDSVVIAYASGTTAHNSDFHDLASAALIATLKARPNARLLLVGYLALTADFDAVRDQIVRFDFVDGAMAFWSLLADADLNLAVLKSTWATDSKSEIKWLEAAALGVPSIVSDTAMYREVLSDGVDALIATTPNDWAAALLRMVDDADLRRNLADGARATARTHYSLAANSARLEALLAPALDLAQQRALVAQAPRKQRKTRVLLVNVWFPPQTIGGATRVLRDNLDAWLASDEADEFEFAVVCTDHDVHPAFRRRVDDYHGVAVHRISTPLQAGEDWRPEDAEVGEIFVDILAAWRPDLVHFHAIQRLTASVVQATQAAGVPYLVTPHDAWWLSDWHFLVDEAGVLRLPSDDLPKNPPPGVTVSQSLDRRRTLARALGGAQKILAVSASFGELYKARGFDQTIPVPNGLPPMPLVPRRPSASGRVRLAHVGNVAKHKGFHLVKAALLQSGFANLELTVIDHGRSGGYIDHSRWGATPVRTVGKLPQTHIADLYAETDVLLAPSIWPESFGLVAREAIGCGLWVVAGDRGAMGDDVVPGVNGFVVDVSTLDGLLEALAAIDADPERYLVSPPRVRRLRSAYDQAVDVAAIYREVANAPPCEPIVEVPLRPIAPHAFDPDFVRAAHPEWAELELWPLYRRWLARDLEAGRPGAAPAVVPPEVMVAAHAAHGDAPNVLAACERAAAAGEPTPWTFARGVRAATALREFDRGFALLDASRRFGAEPDWRAALIEAVDAEFAVALDAAEPLYREVSRTNADAAVRAVAEQATARCRAFGAALEGPKVERRAIDPAGPVLILANLDLPQCTHYRVEQKLEILAALGRPARVFEMRREVDGFIAALPEASAVIVYRLPAAPAQLRGLRAARAAELPIIYDIDDLVFDPVFPDAIERYAGGISERGYVHLQMEVPLTRAALALCDVALTSTPALAERAAPLVRSGRAFVLPNGLDSRDAGWLEHPRRERCDDEVVVFYGSGSPAHGADVLELAGPALLGALARWPKMRLVIAGHLTLDSRFDRFAERIARRDWTPDVGAYWSQLAEADINLAVLRPSPITDAKSEIKWLEAAALGVASIVSDTRRYREVVEDGVDALIADTPAAWEAALDRLIGDADLRAAIGAAARRKAAADYGVGANAARLQAALAFGFGDGAAR